MPYAVVVAVHDIFCGRYSVEAALYGTEAVEINSDNVRRNNDGFFGADARKTEGRHRDVAAVALLQFRAWEPDSAVLWLLENPYALQRLPHGILAPTHRLGETAHDDHGFSFGWTPEEPPDS